MTIGHFIPVYFATGLLAGILMGCGPQGLDYDRELDLKNNGLVYTRGDDKPYTGKAYCRVYDECSWPLGCALHWQGEFKNGREDGEFIFPGSREPNDFYRWGDNDEPQVVRVQFRDGIEMRHRK